MVKALVRSESAWLALGASLASVAAYVYFDRQGTILVYKDAISHMEIARRVVDSPTTGPGQLGGVWLPLPHLLMLPFIWNNYLYYSGLAGSIVSMASYVVTTVLLYKIVADLTGRKLPGLVAALVFAANPNVLYMQSTPMTEMLLFACMAGMVYLVQRWIATDDFRYLMGAGVVAFLGTLTRYEAWVLLAALTVVVFLVAWRKGYGRAKAEGMTLGFLYIAGLGIVGWLVWNLLIFGNPLNFQNGQYAKPSLWVGSNETAVGNWSVSFRTYLYATRDNLGPAVLVLTCLGLLCLLVKGRLKLATLPVLMLFIPLPFFVLALEQGQRPLHVSQLSGDLYNVRFGLLMVLPAAVVGGYFVSLFGRRSWQLLSFIVIAVVVLSVADSSIARTNMVTLREPTIERHTQTEQHQAAAGSYMRRNYNTGLILMEAFGNDLIMPDARISLVNNVYEGSYRLWEPALNNPSEHKIIWIVMRHSQPSDKVYESLHGSPALHPYKLVFSNFAYYIYERR